MTNESSARASPWRGIAAGRSVVFVVLESAASRFVAPGGAGGRAATTAPLPMPFLRSLADAGLDCPLAWAVYPESIFGQVPILCALPPQPGAAPGANGVHAGHSLPHRLRAHGYRSRLFHAGRFRFLGMADVLTPMGFDALADAGTIGGQRESSFGIDEEATVDALLHWVDVQPANAPWLGAGCRSRGIRLFDLVADPDERHDVAASHPAVVGRLWAEAGRFLQDAHAGPPRR